MVIVWGSVIAAEGRLDDLVALGLEHVRRSRREDGCLAHGVHTDAETPSRLVFFEKWADEDALRRHFAVPESREFVRRASELSVGAPIIEIFRTEPIEL